MAGELSFRSFWRCEDMGARVEAGRLGREAIPVVQTLDVDSLDWMGVMEMKRGQLQNWVGRQSQ